MPPLAIFGLDVGGLVEDAVKALVDLIVPDFGADWVSRLVTWLVALPPITGGAFPSLNAYADQLTAVGFGILGATFIGGLLQLWAGGAGGALRAGESAKRAAIAAGALAFYPTVLGSVLTGVNVLTAQMVRHPLVIDGLDKAFGEALAVAAITGGVTLGLAAGAAVAVLYFVAALFVLKLGLTAVLAATMVGGALVWALYPLPQAQWLPRAWLSGVATALIIPIAWACIFSAAALLARDALVFDGGSQFNNPLGDVMAYLVKPLAAVACFWIAYRAPYFLLGLARMAGITAGTITGGGGGQGGQGRSLGATVTRGAQTNADRFRAIAMRARGGHAATSATPGKPATPRTAAPSATKSGTSTVRAAASIPKRANDWWRNLPAEGAAKRAAPSVNAKPSPKKRTAADTSSKPPRKSSPKRPPATAAPPKATPRPKTSSASAPRKPKRAPKPGPTQPKQPAPPRAPKTTPTKRATPAPTAKPAPPARSPKQPKPSAQPRPKPTPRKKS